MEKRKFRIGLINDYMVSEYSELIIKGIKSACADLDLELLIFPIGELHNITVPFDYQYLAIAAFVTKNNLDGIIMSSGTQMHYLSKEELTSWVKSFAPIPIVNISTELPGIPSIIVECYNAYKALLENLVNEQGCRKFGIMSARGNSTEVKIRMKYIQSVLADLKIPETDIFVWQANFDYGATINELEDYYRETKTFNFDAVLCLNDEMAFACMDFCQKLNLKIPEDIIITGFDDILRSSFSTPSLTSINQQIFEQGYEAALALNRLICGEKVEIVKIIDAKTVLRESSCRNKNSVNSEKNKYLLIENKTDSYSNSSATEWYSKKGQFYQITNFYTQMQNDMTVNQLKKRINNDLKSFGVVSCAIVIYEHPIEQTTPFDYFNLPHKATLFSAFDYSTGYDSDNVRCTVKFDPNDKIIPDNIVSFTSKGTIVIALFHNTLQYGYMLFQPGSYDIVVYDLLSKITSTIIASVYSYDLINNESSRFKAKYNKLDIIASTDELTGLNNRRGLYDFGQTTLKFAKAMNQNGIIVYCDMDGLKKINDTFGHEAGDRAIIAESIILKSNFRSNDVVARIGGDEFAIISPGLTVEAFERIKKQIDIDCKNWTEKNNSPFTLSISMGYIPYPSDKVGYQITPLLSEADSCLYIEKRKKKAAPENK